MLLVSTDPASNLDDVLGVPLGREPTPVPGVPGLEALNIDPEAAAELAERTYVVPRLADEPRGAEALRTMIDRAPATRPAA